jgi:hypothetical protein
MTLTRALRWLAPVAVAAAVTGMSAAPGAAAQSDPVSIEVFVADTVTPTGGTSVTELVILADRPTTLTDFEFTFDLAGLADVATINLVTSLYDCTSSGTQLACAPAFEDTEELVDNSLSLFDIEVSAAQGTAVGATGALGVTFEAVGAAPATHESTVTIGAPLDLAADGPTSIPGGPGDTLSLPLTVHNVGPEPAHGVTLLLFQEVETPSQTRYSNCVYFPGSTRDTVCSFDVVLEPGATYALAEPLELLVNQDAEGPGTGLITSRWVTRAEAATDLAEAIHFEGPGIPGTGAPLSLVEESGGVPAPLPSEPVPAADVDQTNNGTDTEVLAEGDNPGGGGGLPVTGAAPGVVALAGLLLIGLGGAGILLVRHRRTRFVA